MSIKKHSLLVAAAIAATVTGASAQMQKTQEPMSEKTALRFFADNNIKVGVNLGNRMDAVNVTNKVATEGEWSWGGVGRTSQAWFDGVAASGADIVRIPVSWVGKIGPAPDHTLDAERLARVDTIVNYAKNAGIKAMIINVHHDGHPTDYGGFLNLPSAMASDDKKMELQDQFAKVWKQIANYFKNYGDYLIFEVMNEVHDGDWGNSVTAKERNIVYEWKQAALDSIRATGGNNAQRFVAFPGLGSTEPRHVVEAHGHGKLLPDDGANGTDKMIVSVHFYDPWRYTVAVPIEEDPDNKEPLLHEWNEETGPKTVNTEIGKLKKNFIDNGIAVYVGEWGAPNELRHNMSQEVKDNHLAYISTVAGAITANGVVPIYWCDAGWFKMFDPETGLPVAGFYTEVYNAMKTAIEANGVSVRYGNSRAVNSASHSMVSVRGRTLSVSSPVGSELSVRMIDVRGKTVARFVRATVPGRTHTFSLTSIPAGRYFVDVKGAGVKQTLPVVVK